MGGGWANKLGRIQWKGKIVFSMYSYELYLLPNKFIESYTILNTSYQTMIIPPYLGGPIFHPISSHLSHFFSSSLSNGSLMFVKLTGSNDTDEVLEAIETVP